ncbi:MAG: radical SAM protein [Planctomycetes bacterium]|nr:radical SAM protein [Planctomycetota bacterium]
MGIGALLPKPLVFAAEKRFPALARRRILRAMPQYVMIQTTSFCNAKCTICPYPDTAKELTMGAMADDLFDRIVAECAEAGSAVRQIYPFLMNEPLMDKKFAERVAKIRRAMPTVKVQIDSNLGLLDEAKAEAATEYCDMILVSAHGITKETYEAISIGIPFDRFLANLDLLVRTAKGRRAQVAINCVAKTREHADEVRAFWAARGVLAHVNLFVTHAGNHKSEKMHADGALGGCCNTDIPLNRLNILYNGDCILCCMDWRREVVLGNLGRSTIRETWNSDAYRSVRDKVYGTEMAGPEFLCRRCDCVVQGDYRKFW